MDSENYNFPQCSNVESVTIEIQTENEDQSSLSSKYSREIISQELNLEQPGFSKKNEERILMKSSLPLLVPKIVNPTNAPLYISSNLPSIASLKMINPPPLFLQALAKLNESSINVAVSSEKLHSSREESNNFNPNCIEISPPDSLTSAPPSYSFVLRQMAARRRPRLMGTFIPSPSFIQHTPPPNYNTAFDIYVDSPMLPPPQRIYSFGFTPMPIVCPECGHAGMTMVSSKITFCTHLCAVILCLLCCWVCAPLPYVLKSCKDVYHYCRNCRNLLGRYCPTRPEGEGAHQAYT